jgi:hypothetical protein
MASAEAIVQATQSPVNASDALIFFVSRASMRFMNKPDDAFADPTAITYMIWLA